MRHKWTEAEIEWLRQNIKQYSWKNIQYAFNHHFGTDLTESSIQHICLRRGITHGRKNEFGFVKGEHNSFSQTRCVGSEWTDSRGRVFIKVSDYAMSNSLRSIERRKNWVQKDRYIWEQEHGKLTKNELLIHLNSDKNDCSPDNLYKVTRSVNMILSANKWFFRDKTMTLAAIKCCELIVAITQNEKCN